jgi:hypothetical protein
MGTNYREILMVCAIEFDGCLGDGSGPVCPYVWKYSPTGKYNCAFLRKELTEMPDPDCPFKRG